MRFSTIIVGAFAAVAAAQSSASTTVAAAASSVSVDPAQSSYVNCLNKCDPSDVNCRAKCGNVPFPNADQTNATNTCAAACPKGTGTEAEVIKWGECVQACIGANYWTSSGGTPQATGASGSGSGSSASASSTSGSSGSNSSPSGSSTSGGSGASQTSAPANPADALRVGTSAAGLVGFLAAFLVL